MRPRIDLIGQKFGRLTVLRFVDQTKFRHSRWLCKCDCGIEKIIVAYDLKNGHTKSCGCLQKEQLRIATTTHGHSKNGKMSLTYKTWTGMMQRCSYVGHNQYEDYGGRGITVCKRWSKFINFLMDMGERPGKGYQIDRINNNKGYSKNNCQWVTPKQNSRNKRNNRLITYKGKTQCLAEWAEQFDIDYYTLKWRLNNGWSIEKTLTTPSRKKVEYVNTYL